MPDPDCRDGIFATSRLASMLLVTCPIQILAAAQSCNNQTIGETSVLPKMAKVVCIGKTLTMEQSYKPFLLMDWKEIIFAEIRNEIRRALSAS